MLACIVQKQSGKRFADFLAERIFRPLGMTHTVAFEQEISTVSERAYGVSRREGRGGWTRTDQSNTSAVLGDGGIYTSIDDMTHWAAALDAGKLVRADLLQQAYTPYRLNGGTSAKYGFGWYLAPFADLPSTYHTGETRGFRNAIRRLPTEGITIIALTNRNEGEPIELVDSLAQRMLARRQVQRNSFKASPKERISQTRSTATSGKTSLSPAPSSMTARRASLAAVSGS